MATQAHGLVRVRMYGVAIALAGGLLAGASATAATLYVGSGGGDYANLAAAVTAASAGDTITIRGGYSTPGASVTKSNLTIRAENNWSTGANNPADMTQVNPARGAESTVTSPISLPYSTGGNASGTKIQGLYFNLASGSGSAIHFPDYGTGTTRVTDITVSNNRFRDQTASAINGWVGIGGSLVPFADRVLVENNRMGTIMMNNATAVFVEGSDWTIKNNYINHNADGGRTTENGRRGFNIFGQSAGNPSNNIVVTGNLFKDLGGVTGNSWALQPNGNVSNLVMANNKFDGNARDFSFYPVGSNYLIAGNQSKNIAVGTTGTGGTSLDIMPGPLNETNVVVRQNSFDVDVAGDKAFRAIRVLAYAGVTAGSLLIENNEITVHGTAGTNTSARGGIRFGAGAGIDSFDLIGPMTIRNNVMDATGYDDGVNNIPSIGFFYADSTGTGTRTTGGMNLSATNNEIKGFNSGAYVDADYTGTVSGTLPTGDSALLTNNNFLNNGLAVGGGTAGAGIGIAGSYFSGNTTNTSGNTYGAAGGSANAVAGRNANYVTFRGDFNLSNAVDATDLATLGTNFGTSGPAATYYKGDATLDQKVGAADFMVWKRFTGLDITSGVPTAQPDAQTAYDAGVPLTQVVANYDAATGNILFRTTQNVWGVIINDGATDLVASSWGSLPANWATQDWSGALDLVDKTAGTSFLTTGTNLVLATVQTGLNPTTAFAQSYWFGTDGVMHAFNIPEPTGLVLLGLGAWGLVARRQRGR